MGCSSYFGLVSCWKVLKVKRKSNPLVLLTATATKMSFLSQNVWRKKKNSFFLKENWVFFLKFPFGSSPFNLWETNLIKFLWALWGSLRLLTTSWISHLFPKWLKILWGCPYVYTVFLTLVVLCLNIFVAVKARNWTVGFSLNSVESGCLKQGLMTLL